MLEFLDLKCNQSTAKEQILHKTKQQRQPELQHQQSSLGVVRNSDLLCKWKSGISPAVPGIAGIPWGQGALLLPPTSLPPSFPSSKNWSQALIFLSRGIWKEECQRSQPEHGPSWAVMCNSQQPWAPLPGTELLTKEAEPPKLRPGAEHCTEEATGGNYGRKWDLVLIAKLTR